MRGLGLIGKILLLLGYLSAQYPPLVGELKGEDSHKA
jgi:hypothetical protein